MTMKTRRDFLRNTLLGVSGAPFVSKEPNEIEQIVATTKVSEPSVMRAWLSKEHRNLFNGDTCVYFYNPELWLPENFTLKTVRNERTGKLNAKPTAEGGPFTAKAIYRYVDTLADNGIDTFVINANASRAWYPSKTIPSILDGYKRGDRSFFRGHAICQGIKKPEEVENFVDSMMAFMNLYQDLLDAGVDWLAETANACRQRNIAPWVSIRMNDMHGAGNFEGSFFNLPLLKQPEMRLQHCGYGLYKMATRQGLNYEKQAVRDLMFEQIREVVEDYNFEGLELDWWRNPLCCEPNASTQTVAMINDWIRQIRALTQRQSKKIGRPYPLGVRIPGRIDILKTIGLDVVTLCQEGTLDFICPSGFWCTTWDMPYDRLRQRVGDNVAIYGVVEDGVNNLATRNKTNTFSQPTRYLSGSPAHIRANAAGKLAMGVDGIEWFNFYCTDQYRVSGLQADYTSLRDSHQLDRLRNRPKQYSFGIGGRNLNMLPFDLPAQLPVILEVNAQHAFNLTMCAEDSSELELIVQIVTPANDDVTVLPVSFNGSWPLIKYECVDELLFPCGPLTHFTNEHVGYNYRFPLVLIRDGWNEIVVENAGKKPMTIACIEVGVRPKAANA